MDVQKFYNSLSTEEKIKLSRCVHRDDIGKKPMSKVMKYDMSSRIRKRFNELMLDGIIYLDDIYVSHIREGKELGRKTIQEFCDLVEDEIGKDHLDVIYNL